MGSFLSEVTQGTVMTLETSIMLDSCIILIVLKNSIYDWAKICHATGDNRFVHPVQKYGGFSCDIWGCFYKKSLQGIDLVCLAQQVTTGLKLDMIGIL